MSASVIQLLDPSESPFLLATSDGASRVHIAFEWVEDELCEWTALDVLAARIELYGWQSVTIEGVWRDSAGRIWRRTTMVIQTGEGPSELAHINRRVASRDNYTCVRCGKRGWDIAHILPKGRYPELKFTIKNLITLCRDCHTATENVVGRRELLALMQKRYGYTYREQQYGGYL